MGKGNRNPCKQSPCTICGTALQSDDMYDVIMYRRLPRRDRERNGIKYYLPPGKATMAHIYLCHSCWHDWQEFVECFGINVAEYDVGV